jgi:phosphatidylserine decarboxylase
MDKVLIFVQMLLPHHALSRGVEWLTRRRWVIFKNLFIRLFIRLYSVDMSQARYNDPADFSSFNAFFTRELTPDARPMDETPGAIVSPVDGTVSQSGAITVDRIFQAKGFDYSLTQLLGGADDLADYFRDGRFATIYLSPRDYHRIHMPLAGTLRETIYVPGRLFSVNRRTTHTLPGLFARNERLVTLFETEAGPMAMILVGALFVSGIETVWDGMITRTHGSPQRHSYSENRAITLARGQEMGRFNMGSTVILLFNASVTISDGLIADTPVQLGRTIACHQHDSEAQAL